MNRDALIADLKTLLDHKHLGAWGMEALIDLLNQLLPELAETQENQGLSHM